MMIMARIKKIYPIFLSLLILLLSIWGCGKEEQKPSGPIDIRELNSKKTLTPLSEVQFYEEDDEQQYWGNLGNRMTKNNNGYYFASMGYTGNGGMFLGYIGSDMQECTPLCNDALCDHKNEECTAYFHEYESQIWSYKDYLYAIKRVDGATYLVRLDMDGRNRKELFEIGLVPADKGDNTTLTFYDDCVYSYDRLQYVLGIGKAQNLIRKRSLDGKTDRYIVTSNEQNCAYNKVRSYNGNLFFTYFSYVYKDGNMIFDSYGLYCYDTKKDELYHLLDSKVMDYTIDMENGKLYCFVLNEGLYEYDFRTCDGRKIYEAGKDTWNCTVSCDGRYIYLENYWSLSTVFNDAEHKERHKVVVLDKSGSVLNEIGNIADIVLFGDEDYLFQFTGARFKTEHNTDPKDLTQFAYFGPSYVKKSEITTAKEFTRVLWP